LRDAGDETQLTHGAVAKTLQINRHFLRQWQIARVEAFDLSHFRKNAVSQTTESRQLLQTRSRNCANHVVGFLAQFRAQAQLPELLAAQRLVRHEEALPAFSPPDHP
jgi:hypothetical protein